jgi:hypothetical protein
MALRRIIVPAIITLAVTILRLIGELRHWSPDWFSPDTGGPFPSGISWIIGITWLAGVFGIYFCIQLIRSGKRPDSLSKAATFSALGILIFLLNQPLAEFICVTLGILQFPHTLIVVWTLWVSAGAIQYFAWPELFKVLLVYAYAARIPVAAIMFFAMLGHWGTHYDYVGLYIPLHGLSRYLWMAFFPQLVGWIGFTLTLGSAAGVFAFLIARLIKLPAKEKLDHIDLNAVS